MYPQLHCSLYSQIQKGLNKKYIVLRETMVRSHPIAVRLEAELEDAVRKQADAWHVSISQAIRNMVYDFFYKGTEQKVEPTDMGTEFEKWLETEEAKNILRNHLRNRIQ